ncbi:MAG: hypothetical protein MUQ10_09645, partial [Anaerolineae bacterium]|nr:hypothetical protein [Anaerolineae bacterium]
MIRRKTQDPVYWSDVFVVSPDDLQYLSGLLIEDELPRSIEELGRAVVLHRCQLEEALVQRALASGILYQPKVSFEVAENVVFPALGYLTGEVVGIRAGRNPEYGDFRVIEVAFDDGARLEFAAELLIDHPLNADVTPDAADIRASSPEELAETHGARASELLATLLEAEPDFVRLAGKWFRKDLLVEVHIGHLNLAEAVLDVVEGGPLPTEELVGPVDLPQEVNEQLRVFSLNYALQEDKRFDEVGPAGEVQWYLSVLEPDNVKSVPRYLRPHLAAYDPQVLTSEMLTLQRALDDEWSNISPDQDFATPLIIALTYPHWRAGTLPFSSRLSGLFPTGRTQRIRFTLIDGETGSEMAGWVVREARYIYGLEEWYRTNHVPVGSHLELEPGPYPGSVVIRRVSARSRREWIRLAMVDDGRLRIKMRKTQITGDYDELMILAIEDQNGLDQLSLEIARHPIPLGRVVADTFPELAKLSPQGSVHVATLYSVVNT